VRTASVALLLLATLAAASGLCTAALMAGITLLDPLLGGDWSLPIAVFGVGVGLTAVGALVPVVAASGLREGRPVGRGLLAVIGLGLCLTPLLPLGAWLAYVALGDDEVASWFEQQQIALSEQAAARVSPPTSPDSSDPNPSGPQPDPPLEPGDLAPEAAT